MQSISLTDKPDVKWEDCAGLQGVKYLLKEATTEPGKTCRAILLSGVSYFTEFLKSINTYSFKY